MKRKILIGAAAFWLAVTAAFAQRHEGGGFGGFGGGNRASVHRLRRVAVPQPNRIANPQHVVNDRAGVPRPERNGAGARITQSAAVAPPAHHAAVVANAGFARGVMARQQVEVQPNHYYWHNEGGLRYAHYYNGGVHWYGFYHGPTFYWTRYYHDRWWWFDARFDGRWCYWWDGFWWWPGPLGLYVYVDNGYYPYDPAGVMVVRDEYHEIPATQPSPGAGISSPSPDNRRLVQITGADGEAYLYDKTTASPTYLKFLARGVEKVRYSGGSGGAPLQILLEFKDGSFALFDSNGKPLDAKDVAQPSQTSAPPAADSSAPPPPGGTSP